MPHSKKSTRFVVDAMLGSLARKLRILGFDTEYYREGDDVGLMRLAKKDRRIILTSDVSLHTRALSAGLHSLFLTGKTDRSRVSVLLRSAKESGIPIIRGDSLCSICGGQLTSIVPEALEGRLPSQVLLHHRVFLSCADCNKVYWKGSHWKRLRALERSFARRRTER